MEYIHGIPLLNVGELKEKKFKFKEIASTISKAFTKLVFKNGFVHSDPHQGNIMIRRHKGVEQVVLLDHGLYTSLEESFRYNYSLVWKAILEQDEITMKKAAIAL